MEQSEREVLERQVNEFRKEAAWAREDARSTLAAISGMKEKAEDYEAAARAKDAAADRIEAMLRAG